MELKEFTSSLPKGRPLLLLDADEVLLRFVEHLEGHLPTVGYELRLTSFQLGGNIFSTRDAVAAKPEDVKALIAGFFESCAHDVPLVPGASEALATLSADYEIAVLSNIPDHCREARVQNLRDHGIDFPVLANRGEKGPAAAYIAEHHNAQIVFVDDLPPQHKSVAQHAPDIHRIHFVADPRLAAMIDKTEHAHTRIDDWSTLTTYLQQRLLEA